MPQPVAWGCREAQTLRTHNLGGAAVRPEGGHVAGSTRQLSATWPGHRRVATAAGGGVQHTRARYKPGGSSLAPTLSATGEALHWSGFWSGEKVPSCSHGSHNAHRAAPSPGSVLRASPGSGLSAPVAPHRRPALPPVVSGSRGQERSLEQSQGNNEGAKSLGRAQIKKFLGRSGIKEGRSTGTGSAGTKGRGGGGAGSQGAQSRRWARGTPLGSGVKKLGSRGPYLLKPPGHLARTLLSSTVTAAQRGVPGSDAPSPTSALDSPLPSATQDAEGPAEEESVEAPAVSEEEEGERAAPLMASAEGEEEDREAEGGEMEAAEEGVQVGEGEGEAGEEEEEGEEEGEEEEEGGQEGEREESPLAPVLREEQQLVSSWQAMLPDATPAARHSYYPRGFEDMDKGERLLTWRTGLILAAVTLVLLFNAKWLAAEIATSAFAIASAMLAVLLLPPLAFAAVGLHLLSRLPEPILDRVVEAAALALTSAAAAYDLALAALDLLPLQPVALGLALAALVLTLHESLAPHPQRADAPLWVSSAAALGYAVGLLSGAQLLASLAASAALAAALQLAYKSGLVASVSAKARGILGRGPEQGTPAAPSEGGSASSPQKVLQQGSGDSPSLQQMALETAVPVAAALVAVADSLVVRVAVLLLYAAGAVVASGVLGKGRGDDQQPASVVKAFLERIRWKALLQRRHLSPYAVVKFVGGFALLVAVRRSALVLYFRLNGA